MRSDLCDAVAPRMSGRCCTTLLDLCAHRRDPALKMPRECLQLWLRCWTSEPSMRSGVSRTWSGVVQQLRDVKPEQR
eukprot:6816138-Pyramimonas_sp.AAC.1